MRRELSKQNKKPPEKNTDRETTSMRKQSIPSEIGSESLNENVLNSIRSKIPENMNEYMNACVGGQDAMITFMSGLGNCKIMVVSHFTYVGRIT